MGHGHVTPNPDGTQARCGGPGICGECSREMASRGGAVCLRNRNHAGPCNPAPAAAEMSLAIGECGKAVSEPFDIALARAAYEAYRASPGGRAGAAPLPGWDRLSRDVQQLWVGAVLGVVHQQSGIAEAVKASADKVTFIGHVFGPFDEVQRKVSRLADVVVTVDDGAPNVTCVVTDAHGVFEVKVNHCAGPHRIRLEKEGMRPIDALLYIPESAGSYTTSYAMLPDPAAATGA